MSFLCDTPVSHFLIRQKLRKTIREKQVLYTLSDLHENEEKKSSLKSKRNIARGGTVCNSHKSAMHADNSENSIAEYSKCPKCHSTGIHEITEKEQANQG